MMFLSVRGDHMNEQIMDLSELFNAEEYEVELSSDEIVIPIDKDER